ncbi:general stress protein [Nesterenkonia cremea]|uniref:General stress protein 17M-like domain-containing protein n=1 Tax=Nesterenkonia cremea TaxID=1882340 RepID=A0A917ARX6_9MICC|nr:general stress protein [Nesterenkonia cremea]GGE65593.1 hypothetical protein GCM10011401_11040 [Nesterenkonia cremea]
MATNPNGGTARNTQTGGLPRGELLGRYRTYEQAQQVVDHLASQDFDIKHLTIVGNDLRSVEHIRSRLTYPRVAGAGAAQGALFGLFIGLLIYLFSPEAPMANMVLSVLMGMGIWMIMGVVSFAVRKGRGFASSSQMVATTFDIVCDFSVSPKARQLVPGAGVPSVNASNDPTGVRPPVGAAPPSGSGAPGAGAEGQPETPGSTAQGQPATGAERKSTGYESLPDGRPRYGVRLSEVEKKESAESGAEAPDAGVADSQSSASEDSTAETPDADREAHRP